MRIFFLILVIVALSLNDFGGFTFTPYGDVQILNFNCQRGEPNAGVVENRCRGQVRNNSTQNLTRVDLKLEFRSPTGVLIDTEVQRIVGNATLPGLASGSTRDFNFATQFNQRLNDISVSPKVVGQSPPSFRKYSIRRYTKTTDLRINVLALAGVVVTLVILDRLLGKLLFKLK